jgi:hypothetical protein
MNDHVAAAAEIARARIGDRERKTGCDRRIDGIAPFLQDIDADARGTALLRHHHAVLSDDCRHRG